MNKGKFIQFGEGGMEMFFCFAWVGVGGVEMWVCGFGKLRKNRLGQGGRRKTGSKTKGLIT